METVLNSRVRTGRHEHLWIHPVGGGMQALELWRMSELKIQILKLVTICIRS